MEKGGVSPVIATVILVGIVMALSIIVFFWFRSFVHESNLKFGKDVSLSCQYATFSAHYSPSDNTLQLSNTGNVPIYSFSVQMNQGSGAHTTGDISTLAATTWPPFGLAEGGTFSGGLNMPSGTTGLILTPVLRGALKNGQQKSYTCDTVKYGESVGV